MVITMKWLLSALIFLLVTRESPYLLADDECSGLPAHYGCQTATELKKICDSSYWFPQGKIVPTLRKWDKLIEKIRIGKDDVSRTELKKFKNDSGLPIIVGTLDAPEVYPNRVDADEVTVGDKPSILFIKRLVLNKNKKSLSIFAELSDPKTEKRIQTWKAFHNSAPVAIRGNELIFEYEFEQICTSTIGRFVTGISVKPNGDYDLIDLSSVPKAKLHTPDECPVKFDCKSDECLGNCSKLMDLNTKKFRYIRYNVYTT